MPKRFAAIISYHQGAHDALIRVAWGEKHTKAQRDEFLRAIKSEIVKLMQGPVQ